MKTYSPVLPFFIFLICVRIRWKWKTVDRKDAIETMVLNGYNMLDEKYAENKEKLPSSKQQNFEGFQSRFESEDKDIRGAKPPYDPHERENAKTNTW